MCVDTEDDSVDMFVTFRKTLKKLLSNEYTKYFGEQPVHMNTKAMMKALRNHACFDGVSKGVDFDVRSVSHNEIGSMLAHMVFTVYTIMCSNYQHFKNVENYAMLKVFAGVIDNAPKNCHAVDRMLRALDYIDVVVEEYPICLIATTNIRKIDAYFEYKWQIKIIDDDENS
jgi:hypothetical protein